jgi:hypothetical protein
MGTRRSRSSRSTRRKIDTQAEAFDELRRREVAKAIVDFSGGNDEGGVDSIVLLDKDENEVGTVSELWIHDRELTDDEFNEDQLARALAGPVYAEYGGFAGDFSAAGTVTWSVADRDVVMRGRHTTWQAFTDSF